MSSEDRWTYPAEGDDSREIDREMTDAETVARMAGHFHSLLASALARPELPLSQLPLLSEPERHQVVRHGIHEASAERVRG